MKVKQLKNRLYKILFEDHQHLLKVSISICSEKGKKKSMGLEKKESKKQSQQKTRGYFISKEYVSSNLSSQPKKQTRLKNKGIPYKIMKFVCKREKQKKLHVQEL